MPVVNINIGRHPSPAFVQALLWGLVLASQEQMRHVRIPSLYTSGVRYRREPTAREQWQTALETARLGYGDCEDLVAYRCAELRMKGVRAEPYCYAPRPGLIHCQVRLPGGKIEDPSKRLGM